MLEEASSSPLTLIVVAESVWVEGFAIQGEEIADQAGVIFKKQLEASEEHLSHASALGRLVRREMSNRGRVSAEASQPRFSGEEGGWLLICLGKKDVVVVVVIAGSDDPYLSALSLRLLRQHGFYSPSSVGLQLVGWANEVHGAFAGSDDPYLSALSLRSSDSSCGLVGFHRESRPHSQRITGCVTGLAG
ncbi:hypothetical protein H6P81_018200 [Aristolochia fimbriata]|uniref:Uncharacterized protein n=1 Tax=Aristolochia fimbriata TaxID=158543 RepID=A0AAV7E3A0_ARIFI|nr:hypothetical protein H6P81_018200 [Aristolochia fimbriata]